MRELTEKAHRVPGKELFRRGFIAGFGWTFGVSIGFVVISTLIVALFNSLGGLPVIGNFLASIIEETQGQLLQRSPLYR